jgi:hypothetical protein
MTAPWLAPRNGELVNKTIDLLADAATQPGHPGFMTQKALMCALRVTSKHTMSEVMTAAAIHVRDRYPGYCITNPRCEGYRLLDEPTRKGKLRDLQRLRSSRTLMTRAATVFQARYSGPICNFVGKSLDQFIATVITPAIEQIAQDLQGI